MRTLALNPCRENPRRRRRGRRRKANPFGLENPRRRRRSFRRKRNPFGIENPRFGGLNLKELLIGAALVSAGAIAARVVPERLLKIDSSQSRGKRAIAAMGTGAALAIFGKKFLGGNAKYIALGALSTGINMLVETKLPAGMRVSGAYIGESMSDEELDKTIKALTQGVDYSISDVPADEVEAAPSEEYLEGVGETYEYQGPPGTYY